MARKKISENEEHQSSQHSLQQHQNLQLQQQQGSQGSHQNQSHFVAKIKSKTSLSNESMSNHSHHNIGNKGNHHHFQKSKRNQQDDDYYMLLKQLEINKLTIREMPGDGNCLFRALGDQLEGHIRNHLNHRRDVVDYMRENRNDFEPFVEDDVPFEKYMQILSQNGTFAGQAELVAFSKIHNVKIYIHQLNKPAWTINPGPLIPGDPEPTKSLHICYMNMDHYNSVRRMGDDSDSPANIQIGTNSTGGIKEKDKMARMSSKSSCILPTNLHQTSDNYNEEVLFQGGTEGLVADYWLKDESDLDKLVSIVMQQTNGINYSIDAAFVKETLFQYNYDVNSTIDFILSLSMSDEIMCQQQLHHEQQENNLYFSNENTTESHSQHLTLLTNVVELNNASNLVANDDIHSSCGSSADGSGSEDGSIGDETMIEEKENSGYALSQASQEKAITKAKSKLSSRQKKDLKRKERRQRRLTRDGTENQENHIAGNQVIVSHLGTIDI